MAINKFQRYISYNDTAMRTIKNLVIEYVSTKNKLCKLTIDIGAFKMENLRYATFEENLLVYESGVWINEMYKKKYATILREIYDAMKITKVTVKKIYYEKCL